LRYGFNKDGIRPPIIDTTNAKRRTLEAQGDANQVGNLQVKIKSLGVLEVQARNCRLMASTLDISSNPVNEVVYMFEDKKPDQMAPISWRAQSMGQTSKIGRRQGDENMRSTYVIISGVCQLHDSVVSTLSLSAQTH
jgi:hypothetical protein